MRFSAYIRNQSEVGVGNVYFMLILLDGNHKIIYQEWTSYLVGAKGYFIVNIDIPQNEMPSYSTYEWEMSSTKPMI